MTYRKKEVLSFLLLTVAICSEGVWGASQDNLPSGVKLPQSGVPSTQIAPASSAQGPAAPVRQGTNSEDEDRFKGLAVVADKLKTDFQKADTVNMSEVDALLKTGRCQVNRVNGLVDRTEQALENYTTAERAYWTQWNEVEGRRLDDQTKKAADLETDLARTKTLIETESQAHEELLRRKANLERYGKRTKAIVEEVDALVVSIKDSEDRLQEAQKQFEEVTTKVQNTNALIATRRVGMNENLHTIESYQLDMKSFYEKKRAEAQEICNMKKPDARRNNLPAKRPATGTAK